MLWNTAKHDGYAIPILVSMLSPRTTCLAGKTCCCIYKIYVIKTLARLLLLYNGIKPRVSSLFWAGDGLEPINSLQQVLHG